MQLDSLIFNHIKAIIFDFDGVIVESINVKKEAFEKLYQKYGDEIVYKVIAHHMANGGMSRFEKINPQQTKLFILKHQDPHVKVKGEVQSK